MHIGEVCNINDALRHVRSKGVRRLPVVDAQNRLQGIVTAEDMTRLLAQKLTELPRIPHRRPA